MAATLKDVAKLAGVSMMTVSRVINGNGYVKEETRLKINEAVEKLNYYPNSLGRSLNTNSIKIIAVMAPLNSGVIENEPYYVRILAGIESVLSEYGYDILLSTQRVMYTENNFSFDFCRPYLERKADGVIMLSGGITVLPREYDTIEQQKIPACLVNALPDQNVLDVVDTKTYEGFRILLDCVYEAGHRKIAFGGLDEFNFSIRERYRCYCDFLKEKNLPFMKDYVYSYPHLMENGNRIIKDYAEQKEKPTVILFSTDNYASGAMEEAKKMGIRIPEDLSITGFDGSPIIQHMVPSLMTIEQPLVEMGRKAAELIIARIKDPDRPFELCLYDTSFREGGSLAPIAPINRQN